MCIRDRSGAGESDRRLTTGALSAEGESDERRRQRAALRDRVLRGGANRLAHAIDHRFHLRGILAFGHDADYRLRPRWPDHQPAAIGQFRLGRGDRLLDAVDFQRLAAPGIAHVLQQLRQRLEAMQHLARRRARALHLGQDLQRGDQTVARRAVIRQDDVPGLLAADVETCLLYTSPSPRD